jgi:hypothetical protein
LVGVVLYSRVKLQEANIEGHMLGRGHTRPKKNYLSSLVGTSNEVNVIVGTINTISLIDTGSSVSTVSHSFYIDNFSDLPIHPIKELLRIECHKFLVTGL